MNPYSQGTTADHAYQDAQDNRTELARLRLVVRSLVAICHNAKLMTDSDLKQVERLIGPPTKDGAWLEYLTPRR